jgi:hypothetical protein
MSQDPYGDAESLLHAVYADVVSITVAVSR